MGATSQKMKELAILLAIATAPSAILHFDKDILRKDYLENTLSVSLYASYFFLPLTAFFGIRARELRIFFTSLLFAASLFLLTADGIKPLHTLPQPTIAVALSVSIPLSLILLFGEGDARVSPSSSMPRLALSILPPALLLSLMRFNIIGEETLYRVKLVDSHITRLPQIALLLALAFLVQSALQRKLRSKGFKHSVSIALLPFFSALNHAVVGGEMGSGFITLNFASLSLVLFYSIYQHYWQKIYIDDLTGLQNRRAFNEVLERISGNYAIAMVDIDHFKRLNDTYGHAAGDDALRFIARILEGARGATAYRYGGEEFALIFKGSHWKEIENTLDSLRAYISKRDFHIRQINPKRRSRRDRGHKAGKGERVRITVSAGVALNPKGTKPPEDVLAAADHALYKAKEEGRNRIVMGK